MPAYKVIKPGYYNDTYYDPNGKRRILVVTKPFNAPLVDDEGKPMIDASTGQRMHVENEMPSWVIPMDLTDEEYAALQTTEEDRYLQDLAQKQADEMEANPKFDEAGNPIVPGMPTSFRPTTPEDVLNPATPKDAAKPSTFDKRTELQNVIDHEDTVDKGRQESNAKQEADVARRNQEAKVEHRDNAVGKDEKSHKPIAPKQQPHTTVKQDKDGTITKTTSNSDNKGKGKDNDNVVEVL